MDIYDIIRTRKSVRSFDDRPVEPEKLNRLLEAAMLAPSASNRQEWRFVVVTDSKKRRRLAEAASQSFVAQAPVVLACCAETDHHVMRCGLPCYSIDVAIAIDHITLAAASEGLGTCWIGAFDSRSVKSILNIPGAVEVVELLPLGYPSDPTPVPKNRLMIEEIVYYNEWRATENPG
jgi:nitroreductase